VDYLLISRKQTFFMYKYFFVLLFLSASLCATAQLRYGFKTGLNFCTIKGEPELDAGGLALEKWGNNTGFHIGISLAYPFTDNFSIRGEFQYSKRGGKYTYDGEGFRIFKTGTSSILATGKVIQNININTSYLDFPIMAVGRWKDFELSAGGYFGFNIQSFGEGGLTFKDGKTVVKGINIATIEQNLSYNYNRDELGETVGADKLQVSIDGAIQELPKTLGAYHDLSEGKGSLFNTFDYGLVGGLSYFISRSLYIGGRIQYGLADISNQNVDVSKSKLGENNTLILRDDKDRNFAIQASVGFTF
jgi:Outer membrane protein beta-barrel domain